MATSVDELKALASVKLGFARNNKFLVTLPGTFGGESTRNINILCSNASLPAKTIITNERRIGMEFQKMAYGYAVDDVSMTFYLMNDYGVKKYFDNWRSSVINETGMESNYKKEYAKFQSSTKAKKDRASRNKVRRQALRKGTVKKGDGTAIDHKDGNPRNNSKSNLRVTSRSANARKK